MGIDEIVGAFGGVGQPGARRRIGQIGAHRLAVGPGQFSQLRRIDVHSKHVDAFPQKPEHDGLADAAAGSGDNAAAAAHWRIHDAPVYLRFQVCAARRRDFASLARSKSLVACSSRSGSTRFPADYIETLLRDASDFWDCRARQLGGIRASAGHALSDATGAPRRAKLRTHPKREKRIKRLFRCFSAAPDRKRQAPPTSDRVATATFRTRQLALAMTIVAGYELKRYFSNTLQGRPTPKDKDKETPCPQRRSR